MRIAFLGMGIMGRPMAANLVKAGHEVTVWNRTPGKDVAGAKTASTPADAVKEKDVVWMCVSDTKAVEQVLFGQNGAAQALQKGTVVVDSSTISPSASVKFAGRVRERGCDFLDAPVTGSKNGAEAGTLIFIVGGKEQTITRIRSTSGVTLESLSPQLVGDPESPEYPDGSLRDPQERHAAANAANRQFPGHPD